jgi:hypothetical protein
VKNRGAAQGLARPVESGAGRPQAAHKRLHPFAHDTEDDEMNGAMLRIPVGEAGDPGDVADALEVAGALWEKGDTEEATRWLKRAVDASIEAGEGARADSLRHALAELEASTDRRHDAATKSTPVTTPPILSDVATNGSGASRPPPAPPVSPASRAPPVSSAVAAPEAWIHDVRMRVSVKTSVRDPRLLLIRPLADGQAAPAGTREGFLLLAGADGDIDARSSSSGGGQR